MMAKKTPYIVIAFSIAGILSVLSYFDAYDYIENLLLDLRFLDLNILLGSGQILAQILFSL